MSAPSSVMATFVHGTGDGERLWLLGGLYTYKATGDETADAYTLFEVRGHGGLSTPMHRHDREEEGFYVASGTVTVFVDGVDHEMSEGSFAFVPRGTSHGFRLDSAEATLLLLITPGNAGHESMFREMGEPASGPAAPLAGPVDVELLAAIAGRNGTTIVGPPPAPAATRPIG
jgi:quercetin dioxygenase-like cupin family protein